MDLPRILKLIKEIASEVHAGQKRDGGEDYICHPARVAGAFPDDILRQIIAWGHDIIEDYKKGRDAAIALLRSRGIPEAIILRLLNVTRGEKENYYDFIIRIGHSDMISIDVKIADLNDNMSDLAEGSRKDKYRFAKAHLLKRKQEMEDEKEMMKKVMKFK